MSRLAEIEARLKAATPGPWTCPRRTYEHPYSTEMRWSPEDIIIQAKTAVLIGIGGEGAGGDWGAGCWERDADAEFIAHAPEDIAYLLAALRAVGAEPEGGE